MDKGPGRWLREPMVNIADGLRKGQNIGQTIKGVNDKTGEIRTDDRRNGWHARQIGKGVDGIRGGCDKEWMMEGRNRWHWNEWDMESMTYKMNEVQKGEHWACMKYGKGNIEDKWCTEWMMEGMADMGDIQDSGQREQTTYKVDGWMEGWNIGQLTKAMDEGWKGWGMGQMRYGWGKDEDWNRWYRQWMKL